MTISSKRLSLSQKRLRRYTLAATLAIIGVSFLESPLGSYNNVSRRAALMTDVAKNLADVTTPIKDTDTAIYWHVPKSGGTSIKAYYSCMGLVESSQKGRIHEDDEELKVYIDEYGMKYVNVDTSKKDGVLRAKQLGLAESGLADVIFTPFALAIKQLLSPTHQGRVFALFRHPIDQMVSLFYYKQIASWEVREGVYRPDLKGVDIETWLERGEFEDNGNFLVSKLVGKKPKSTIDDDDLEMAKEILKTKFVVGLMSKIEESVDRFDQYFGWTHMEKRSTCHDRFISQGVNKNSHQRVEEGSKAWKMLEEMVKYDLQLYEYAVELFEEQAILLGMTKISLDGATSAEAASAQ